MATLSTIMLKETRLIGRMTRTSQYGSRARSSATRVSQQWLPRSFHTDNIPDTKQTRVVKKTMPTESFFNFFDPPKAPAEEDADSSDDVEERLELDYQLGEDIKEKLIPRAIDWFTGEALQFEELDDDLEEADFEDEDDEDDDDLSEDKDDEDESDEEVRERYTSPIICTDPISRMRMLNPSKRQPSASRVDHFLHNTCSRSPLLPGHWEASCKTGA